ncbi:CDP-glycerol glycerophosphotransferase family protein [Solicola gregarius]|uniref:CDP-glycerol glycerophosphotransferase family protein n=1 Tax=Solicola gregarius TaxID=2908642 RepID=A0AA46TL97_9ACTN|nr:CDP-glycerol glycerophosphotransferase family protein [Solicola gregarius]UYM06992.1 CDP-glycerol glycerophosphotransferase family protein [Solicola gregarius]
MTAEVHVSGSDEPTTVPLLVSRELNDALPLPVQSRELEGVVERGVHNLVRISLNRPLGRAAGRVRQNRLRAASGEKFATGRRRGLLIRSYFGESATDSGLGLQRELQRRGVDMDIYWSVQDHSIPVPDGAIPVIQNSYEWYGLLNSAKYYLDNMYQPEYHQKPDGQVIIQTFHGYPFKTMGHPHWEQSHFSRAKIDSYDARARDWDYLVSPASYATPLLKRDFAYDGEVLEIGYPRNDVLFAPEAPQIRAEVRRVLGIADHQTAVLYAPTFRDYLSPDDMRAEMVDFLDLDEAAQGLGGDYVLLVRGHAFNARTDTRVGRRGGIIDVTDYPLVSDLYLAVDAAVVDYSSLRFDFGVTGKPMIFHVPDLEHYKSTRGWLFDYEPTAPGPLVSTTGDVVDSLLELDAVAKRYRNAYNTFRHAYLDLEDGHASARLVDQVFVPRGDAPPA